MHLLNHLFLIKVGLINKKYDSNAVKLAFESYFIAFSEFYRTAIILLCNDFVCQGQVKNIFDC